MIEVERFYDTNFKVSNNLLAKLLLTEILDLEIFHNASRGRLIDWIDEGSDPVYFMFLPEKSSFMVRRLSSVEVYLSGIIMSIDSVEGITDIINHVKQNINDFD